MAAPSRSDLDVAVIGAGPHGLAAAVQLRRAGIRASVFGEPFAFWRGMPEGMLLRSNTRATNLIEPGGGPYSLSAYAARTGIRLAHPVALRRFVEYGMWVARDAVPDLDRRLVASLAARRGGFELVLADGTSVTARRVVLACGIADFAHVPERFSDLPAQLASHISIERDLSRFAGRRVAIVGGGQSALESAVLMRERAAAEVEVIARAPQITFLRSWSPIHFMGPLGRIVYAPTDVGPLWYSRLVATPALLRLLPAKTRERIAQRSIRPACSYFVKVRLDGVTITLATEVRRAHPDAGGLRLELSDGTVRRVDHLLLATGYRIDVRRYPFLHPSILDRLRVVDGYPQLRRGLESSVDGLHILGAPAARSFGPTMRFVSGSWYAASRTAAEIAARTRRRRSLSQ